MLPHISARLSDGSTVTGQPEHVHRALRIDGQMRSEEQQWIAELRAAGIKAAHPNDGWVDREKLTVTFAYPQFNDGAGPGDLVALGWPGKDVRLVRLLRWEKWRIGIEPDHGHWHFEDAER